MTQFGQLMSGLDDVEDYLHPIKVTDIKVTEPYIQQWLESLNIQSGKPVFVSFSFTNKNE